MKIVKIKAQKKIILDKCDVAQSFTQRLVGLLSRSNLKKNEALLIEKCKQVHTCFMRFPIDAIFLDKNNVVVGISELKPWRFSKYFGKAENVLETNIGFARQNNISPGLQLEVLDA